MELLIAIIAAITLGFFQLEAEGCCTAISRWLIRRAAKVLPEEMQDWFIEENYAIIDDIKGPISKLWNGIGMYVSGHKLKRMWRAHLLRVLAESRRNSTDNQQYQVIKSLPYSNMLTNTIYAFKNISKFEKMQLNRLILGLILKKELLFLWCFALASILLFSVL